MRPSPSTTTTPKSSGFATRLRTMVTSAPRALWAATTASRSMSVRASPEITMKASSARYDSASLTLPAVPAGEVSTE